MPNYLKYDVCDLVNGKGVRVVLWMSGCSHACEGCHNRSTWNSKAGEPLTEEVIEKLLDACESHTGLTLTGGDPFFKKNRDILFFILEKFKKRYPDKDVWVWTGYLYEELKDLPHMQYIDVLVDGKYEQSKPSKEPWIGSSNQRVIYLKEVLC